MHFQGGWVNVPAGAITRQETLHIRTAPTLPSAPSAKLMHPLATGVSVDLSGLQPLRPLTIALSVPRTLPSGARPQNMFVATVPSSGPAAPVLLATHYDSADQMLVAQADHLSSFYPVWRDGQALVGQFTREMAEVLQIRAPQPGLRRPEGIAGRWQHRAARAGRVVVRNRSAVVGLPDQFGLPSWPGRGYPDRQPADGIFRSDRSRSVREPRPANSGLQHCQAAIRYRHAREGTQPGTAHPGIHRAYHRAGHGTAIRYAGNRGRGPRRPRGRRRQRGPDSLPASRGAANPRDGHLIESAERCPGQLREPGVPWGRARECRLAWSRSDRKRGTARASVPRNRLERRQGHPRARRARRRHLVLLHVHGDGEPADQLLHRGEHLHRGAAAHSRPD